MADVYALCLLYTSFQRGNIVDSNGTVLATSVAVYNVVLDCSVMTSKKEYITPTIDALTQCFPDLDKMCIRDRKYSRSGIFGFLLKETVCTDRFVKYMYSSHDSVWLCG